MKNFIHLEPMVKRKDRAFNGLMSGDKILITIKGETHQHDNSTEIEIEPLQIIREEDRTIEMKVEK